jgi:hypothetical protein
MEVIRRFRKEVQIEFLECCQQVAKLDGEALYNSVCAACHGPDGKGDGPAARALHENVPDLTSCAADNDGVFPHRRVQVAISGNYRNAYYGTIDAHDWEQQFMYVRPGLNPHRREALARDRLHALTTYIETLQTDRTAFSDPESERFASE